MERPALLLLAHGTPEHIEEIPAYLANIAGGRPMPEAVVREVERRYRLIGHSPLTELTMQQAALVEQELQLPVYVGMRNWKPYISEAVEKMAADGITRAVALCMAPHNSRTSVGMYRKAMLGRGGELPFTIEFIPEWHSEAGLIEAFAKRLRAAYASAAQEAGGPLTVLFTAHSVPLRSIEAGDDYQRQTRETAELVASACGRSSESCVPAGIAERWRFAYQSQGMSGGEWLGPTVESVIDELAAAGEKHLLAQPVGFLCDHVEILYDIDIGFKSYAAERGVTLTRVASLNDSPLLARAIAGLARKKLLP